MHRGISGAAAHLGRLAERSPHLAITGSVTTEELGSVLDASGYPDELAAFACFAEVSQGVNFQRELLGRVAVQIQPNSVPASLGPYAVAIQGSVQVSLLLKCGSHRNEIVVAVRAARSARPGAENVDIGPVAVTHEPREPNHQRILY